MHFQNQWNKCFATLNGELFKASLFLNSLPFCAGVQFSDYSIRAFNDRKKDEKIEGFDKSTKWQYKFFFSHLTIYFRFFQSDMRRM